MNNTRRDNDLIKEIIEKHFEDMVNDILEHTETYSKAFHTFAHWVKNVMVSRLLM